MYKKNKNDPEIRYWNELEAECTKLLEKLKETMKIIPHDFTKQEKSLKAAIENIREYKKANYIQPQE